MVACMKGHAAVVRLLLYYKADLTLRDKERNYTAKMFAQAGGYQDIVDMFPSDMEDGINGAKKESSKPHNRFNQVRTRCVMS